MMDIFNQDAFSLIGLTQRINNLPYVPGQISAAGYFQSEGIDVLTVALERRDGSLSLVGPTARGGPGETVKHDRETLRYFGIPHFQRDDGVMADEVQGRRAFGTMDERETLLQRIDMKVQRHLRDFDATIEHQRVGAIKGIVTNKAGGVMMNLYQLFEITPPTPIFFNLSSTTTNLQTKAKELIYRFEDASESPYSGIDAWCGRDFFDAFVDHQYMRDAYKALQDRVRLLGVGSTDAIEAFGINWRRYRTGQKAQAANMNAPFIGATECRFVPRGIPNLFRTYYGPADYEETVNTLGLPRYLKQIPMDNGKGRKLEVQSNPLNVCTMPELLFSGSAAAS